MHMLYTFMFKNKYYRGKDEGHMKNIQTRENLVIYIQTGLN
jgi:hypothetical protein